MQTVDDQDWAGLFDEDNLTARRREAEDTYRDFSTAQIQHMRKKAKSDLFFLCKGVLGYDRMSPDVHGHLCSWMEATRNDRYRIELLPRGHYKSTVITIGEAIQMALPNVDNVVKEWPYSLGPDIKILLGHENRESASRFLFEITEAFVAKPLMLALFPECIPSRRVQRMSKWELDLPRSVHHKEPTFDTIGAGGAAQGRHYNWLKLDDLIGEDARESEVVMGRTLRWFDNVNSLLTRVEVDGWDLTGTRWSFKDVYSHALEVYGVNLARSVVRCMQLDELMPGDAVVYARGAMEREAPIFPEEFSPEFFTRMRKNPIVYAAQYANNPRESGLNEFDVSWLKYYNRQGQMLYVFEPGSTRRINIWDLDITILVDPSMGEKAESDESGIIVTGTDAKNNIYILETIKERLIAPEIIRHLFELYNKWSPRLISIESVAFSGVLGYWFRDHCNQLQIWPTIYEYKPGSRRSKTSRIRGLANYFANGQVYMQEGMHQLRDEYEWFGITDSEHLLDALAQGPEVWRAAEPKLDVEELHEAEEFVMNMRDSITGY